MSDEWITFPKNAGNPIRYFVTEEIKKRVEAEAELAKIQIKWKGTTWVPNDKPFVVKHNYRRKKT